MKKFLLSMAALAMAMGVNAASYTIFDIANPGTWTGDENGYTQTLTVNGAEFTISTEKGSSTTNLLAPSNDSYSWRVYKNSDVKIVSADVDMKTIVITYDTYEYNGKGYAFECTLSAGWTGNLNGVVYTLSSEGLNSMTMTADQNQVRIKTIVVSDEAGEVGGGDDPVVDPQPVDNNTVWMSLSEDATTCDWDFVCDNMPAELTYVWKWKAYNDKYYLNGSAYLNETAYPVEAYAISPVVDLTSVENATCTFEHAAKFQKTLLDLCKFVIREEGATEWTDMEIQEWPVAGGWNFVNAGTYDLAKYTGKKIQFGFKYASSTNGADTWEIKNFKVNSSTAVTAVEAENGEAVYFDFSGRRVNNPAKGMYVKVLNGKAQKVVVK